MATITRIVKRISTKRVWGKIWRTNPKNDNTDGDDFSDGEEMGEYQPRAEIPHFKRKSNPLITTKITGKSEIIVSEEMYSVENGDNTITVMIDVDDCQYKLENGIEYVYSPAKNVSVNIIKYPDNVMTLLSGWPRTDTKDDTGSYKHYSTVAKFSYVKNFIFSPAVWEINADGTKYQVDLGGLWEKPHIYKIRHALLKKANSNMDEVERLFFKHMQESVKKIEVSMVKPEDTDEFKSLKEEIQSFQTNKNVDEGYCAAFALALLQHINKKIGEIKITNESGMWSFISYFCNRIDESVTYNSSTYTVKATLWAGSTSLGATVRKTGQKEERLNWVSDKDGERVKTILNDYTEALVNLNNKNWSDFVETFKEDLTELIGMPTFKSILGDAFLYAFCDGSAVGQEAMKTIIDKFKDFLELEIVDDSFEDYLGEYNDQTWENFKSKFIPAMKNAVENGDDFTKSAEKIKIAKEKLSDFEMQLFSYNSSTDKKKADKDIEKAWGEFKSAYEALGGSGIFGNWYLFVGYNNDLIEIPTLEDYH